MSTIISVGTYQLGYRPVELLLDTSHSAGSAIFVPEREKGQQPLTRLTVGTKDVPLWGAWGTLLHEALEASLCDHHTSYRLVGLFNSSTEERLFVFDHRTFTRACDETGNFLNSCKRDFDRAYRKATRKKSPRRKRK